jgi:type II secretory pathway pseudopilin PulG
MSTFGIVLLVILAILVIAVVALYFIGKKAQKKQEEQQTQMEAMKQTVSMLIIDKKRMKIKDSGLPQAVIDQTPKMMRGSKLPIVKAKVGPQIMSLVCDEKIFDKVPVKKEVKASVSGIYILDVKGLRGNNKTAEPPKKQGVFKRAWAMAKEKAGVNPVK